MGKTKLIVFVFLAYIADKVNEYMRIGAHQYGIVDDCAFEQGEESRYYSTFGRISKRQIVGRANQCVGKHIVKSKARMFVEYRCSATAQLVKMRIDDFHHPTTEWLRVVSMVYAILMVVVLCHCGRVIG